MASPLLAARNLAADRTRLDLTVVANGGQVQHFCSRDCRTEFLEGAEAQEVRSP